MASKHLSLSTYIFNPRRSPCWTMIPFLLLLLLLLAIVPSSSAFSSSTRTTTKRTRVTTALRSSMTGDDNNNDDNDFMKSLQSRMTEIQQRDTRLPIVVLDTMLPRQVLKIQVENPVFQSLIKHLVETERPRFGMVGMAQLSSSSSSGQSMPLQNGVEVELVDVPKVVPASHTEGVGGDIDEGLVSPGGEQPASSSSSSTSSEQYALQVTLKAGRRFRIASESLKTNEGGWTEATVQFLQSQEETLNEDDLTPKTDTTIGNNNNNNNDDSSSSSSSNEWVLEPQDPLSLARAMTLASKVLSQKNDQGRTIMEEWIALAEQNERSPGQIQQLLQDLGNVPPPATRPTDLAFYIGALINPLPGMGVAMEIRPLLLMATTAEERLGVALKGLEDSVGHMNGTKRLF